MSILLSTYFGKGNANTIPYPTLQLPASLKEAPDLVARSIPSICLQTIGGQLLSRRCLRAILLNLKFKKCVASFLLVISLFFAVYGACYLIKASTNKEVLGEPILFPKGITLLVIAHTFMYFLWLITLTLGLLLVGGAVVHKTSEIMQMTAEYIDGKIINEYKSGPAVQDMIDHLQTKNKCCGGSSFRVYEDVWQLRDGEKGLLHVPISCCSASDCTVHGNVTDLKGIFHQGCFSTLEDAVRHEVQSLSAALLIFGIITLMLELTQQTALTLEIYQMRNRIRKTSHSLEFAEEDHKSLSNGRSKQSEPASINGLLPIVPHVFCDTI
ncbi:hypothetical protein SprV_0501812400 [Sparganum proliferum]